MIIVFTLKKIKIYILKLKTLKKTLIILLYYYYYFDTKQAKNHCNKHKHATLGRRE